MSDLTRRGFVKGSAGAAAGVTVLSALLAEQADAHADPGSRPVVAYVKNPKRARSPFWPRIAKSRSTIASSPPGSPARLPDRGPAEREPRRRAITIDIRGGTIYVVSS